MSKSNYIPTTSYVSTFPGTKNQNQFNQWLIAVAGFANGCQEVKEMDVAYQSNIVGYCKSIRCGSLVFSIISLKSGTYVDIDVVPTVVGSDSVFFGNTEPVKAITVLSGTKKTSIELSVNAVFTGFYLAGNNKE